MKRKASVSFRPSKRTRRASEYRVQDVTAAPGPLWIKNKKAVKVKMPKKIKVSAKLKAKIEKVIDKKVHVNGSYTNFYLGGTTASISRKQNVLADCGSFAKSSWLFTVPQFLDAVSVLWNGKPNRPPASSFNFNCQFQNSDNFSTKTTVFKVKNSYSVYTFKNSTQHTVNLIVVVGVPKRKGSGVEWTENAGTVQNAVGGLFNTETAMKGLYQSWVDALAQDSAQGYNLNGYFPGAAINTIPVDSAPNVDNLFRDPASCKTLRDKFKIEEVHIRLLPGQIVRHTVQGPKGVEIDMAKMYDSAGILLNIQKYSRSVLGICYNDPNHIATFTPATGLFSDARSGRFGDQIDNTLAGFSVVVERQDHFSLTMPEQTGFRVTEALAVGSDQPLNFRFPKTVMNIYDKEASAVTNQQLVDLSVMNPVANVNAAAGGT